MGIRAIVCGGRDYDDTDHIHNMLLEIDTFEGHIDCVIHGCATGAAAAITITRTILERLGTQSTEEHQE